MSYLGARAERTTSGPHGPMTRPLREAGLFIALAYAFAIVVALCLPDSELAPMLTVLMPLLAVALVGVAFVRRGHRRAYWAGLGLQRPGFRWWPVAVAIPVVVAALAYAVAIAVGVAELPSLGSAADWIRAEGINLLINATIGAVFILGEEIGWRGFLLPRLHTVLPPRSAWIVTGLVHGLFHLPLILLTTTYDSIGSRWIIAPSVVVVVTGGGVIYGWLRDRSGSLWPVTIAHNAINVCFETAAKTLIVVSPTGLAYVAGEGGWATMCATWLAAGIVLAAHPAGRAPQPAAGLPTVASGNRPDRSGAVT